MLRKNYLKRPSNTLLSEEPEKLQELQEGNYQPAWNEIKNLSNVYDVPKFGGSQTVAGKGKK